MQTSMQKKIKILFTIPNFTTAGSGREMFNIVERLDKTLFDILIITQKEGGNLYYEIIAKGYKLLVQPYSVNSSKNGIDLLLKSMQLAKLYKPHKIDIWQSFNWSSDFSEALVAKWSGAKYLYVKKNMNWDRLAWKIKTVLSNKVVVRNTTMLQRFFSSALYKNKTAFITGGVDVNRFRTANIGTVRKDLNVTADASLITCVAQIVKVKGQATLIKAISKIDNVFVVLAGASRDKEYDDELRLLIKDLQVQDKVLLAGPVSDVNSLLHESDMFVLPTTTYGGHEEGCPVALLEAMAAGTPCIASDVSGSRDLIVNGQTGLLYTQGNEDELTLCINKYLTDKDYAKLMSENANKEVYSKHTLDIEAKAFSDLYIKMSN